MGNANRKSGELPDELTGLTEGEVKLIQQTWRNYCRGNNEYGVPLFLNMFLKHPDYIQLFKTFRGKSVVMLKDDPAFRAHGCSIGYHITSIVESLRDPATFEILVRRNASEHLRRKGVKPFHFQVMGQCLVDVLQTTDARHMTPGAIEAWGKFLTCMVIIIKDVFEKAAAERCEKTSTDSADATEYYSRSTTVVDEAMMDTAPLYTAGEICPGGKARRKEEVSPKLPSAGGGASPMRQPRIIRKISVSAKKSSSGPKSRKAGVQTELQQEKGRDKESTTKEKTAEESVPKKEGP